MNRVVLAALALLLAGHGCAADDQTTTMEERRLTDTTMAETPDDVSGAVARSGRLGTLLLALLAFLYVGNAAAAAVDESTTMADERRLTDTTMAETPDDVSGAVARSGSLGTLLLVLLAFLYVGNAAAAAMDESTTMADERRLTDTTMAETPDDVSGAVARSGSLGTLLLALLAFLFVGNAAGAAVDESTTMADERRLTDTTMAETPDDVSAAPRAAIRTTPVFALAAALGLAARR